MSGRTTTKNRVSEQPYKAQPRLISSAELRFFHTVLQPCFGDRFYIGVQVPMTAVLRVDQQQWDKAAGRKIRQKRLDFVLAYPKTFRIAAVIELDDLSHREANRRRRDRFVETALAGAGVLLIRVPVYRKYDVQRICSSIHRRLREHRTQRTAS